MQNASRCGCQRKVPASVASRVRSPLWMFLAALFLCVAAPSWARGMPQEEPRALVGSLTVNGAVEVNGALVSTESMVFAGDSVATRENGRAALTIDGRGELDIAPRTRVVFSDDSRYLALVDRGTITFNAFGERSNLAVRVGDYIVGVAPGAPPQTAATVQREDDGSGLVSCAAGSVQVLAIQGDTSLSLEGGQSTSLDSENPRLAAVTPSDPILQRPPRMVKKHWLRTVLILACGAAVAAAIVATHRGGGGAATSSAPPSPTPSPSPSPTPSPTPSPNPTPLPVPIPL